MSLESAKEFLKEFQGNSEFRSSIEGAGDDDTRRQLARDAGYDFTREEVKEAMGAEADVKISDEDLEAVAGGKSAAWIAVALAAAALAA